MPIHTDTHTIMSCPTTIVPISTRSMNFGRNPTLSSSALITTDSSSLTNQLPQLTKDIVKSASSKSCQTSSIHHVCTPSYSRRKSLAKVMPTLSKKIADKNDASQQQRNYAAEVSPKKVNNHDRQISSINTDLSSTTRNNNVNESQHQQQSCSADNKTPTTPCHSPTVKALRRPSPIIHTASGSDDETNSTRNNNKHGSVLNPTVPASTQKQKQKQQQRGLSRGGTSSSSPQLFLPQQRRLSSPPSTTGIVKQNKTETLRSPPSLTKLQNTKKTPLGTHPAGTVTSDSGSDGDDAASTMDNNHMKQQKHRALSSQPQLQTGSRRTNHYSRLQPILHQNDSLLLHQRRTSIASLSPLPHPNGISSTSSSTLVRRRSLADISPRSSLAPSASSTMSQHHHHQYHHHHQQQQNDQDNKQQQQQQNLRHSQSHLRHPSWLESAGFMRPSKCSICHPPPPKKSVITPPVGMGVPKFGLPPPSDTSTTGFGGTTTSTTTTSSSSSAPKYSFDRRPSSRNGLMNERLSRYGHSFGLSSSSTASAENGRTKNSIVYTDGMARMDQRRRLSLPNTGNTTVNYLKTTATAKKKLGLERRSSFYNTGAVTNAADHNTTHRFSSKRMVAPRTKMGKQQPPDTPVLDKDFTNSPSSSSSLTEANTDTISTSSSNPSPITADESRPSTPIDMKHQMTQLMEPDYLKTLDGGNNDGYLGSHDILNEPGLLKLQPSPAPVVTNDDVTQCSGNSDLIQHSMGGAFQRLQTFLELSPTTAEPAAYSKKSHRHHQQNDFEISPTSVLSEDTCDVEQCTSSSASSTSASSSSLSEMSLHLQDSSNDTTTHHSIQPSALSSLAPTQPPSSSVLSDLEQWTTMVRLTLGRWFTDLNHGQLEHYDKATDGSITTMIITGYVVTMEADLVHPSSSSLAEKIHQHRYTLYLGPEERRHAFATISSSSDSWAQDDQVNQCQFKTKASQCECEFDWINRRHHCRRCGDIFCKAHSTNRLPLFTKKNPDQIKWSRVCDSCCYDLVGASLVKL